jgi:phage terminase large subunit-like protein
VSVEGGVEAGVVEEPVALRIPRTPGKYERLCVARHERDLALAQQPGGHPKGFVYDEEVGQHAVDFIEGYCKHHKGEWAGKPLILEEWQREVVRIIFGWLKPELDAHGTPTGEMIRRFTIAYIEIPRKNGKSELAAAIALYLLTADGEPGAEVYASATKKDQAKIVWDTAAAMVKASPDLKRFVKVQRNNLSCAELGSKMEPLGADSNTLDGLNPHGNVVDELHAHRDRGVWDVLDTAMGARRQPLTLAITTSGTFDPESIGWLQHDHATKVLEGFDTGFEDDGFFAFIAAADDDADWTLPETWAQANPNFGVSVKPAYLAQQCEKAKTQPSFLNTFLRLHLDRWTQQRDRWLSVEQWNACDRAPLSLEALRGRIAYGGLDLAATIDIAAFALCLPREVGGKPFYDFLLRFYCPEETIAVRSQKDRVPYDAWVRDGWLTATPGNVIDYAFIREDVKAAGAVVDLREVGYDKWNALQLATQLEGDGFTLVEMRQGFQTMSEPSKEFEKLIVSKCLGHGDNPILRWMVSNVSAREDPNGNIAPDKSGGQKERTARSSRKIDGVVASIMALGRAIVQPVEPASVYETRGVRSF